MRRLLDASIRPLYEARGKGEFPSAKVLAAAIKRVEGADLVLTATESSDGYTGTVPEQLAEVRALSATEIEALEPLATSARMRTTATLRIAAETGAEEEVAG